MSLRLERLAYESTATGTTGSLANLAVIVAESQRNNDRDGLTGRWPRTATGISRSLRGPPRRWTPCFAGSNATPGIAISCCWVASRLSRGYSVGGLWPVRGFRPPTGARWTVWSIATT